MHCIVFVLVQRSVRSSSPRPSSTRRSHRPGLASIGDDEFEDEELPEAQRASLSKFGQPGTRGRGLRDAIQARVKHPSAPSKFDHESSIESAAVSGGHRHSHAPFTYQEHAANGVDQSMEQPQHSGKRRQSTRKREVKGEIGRSIRRGDNDRRSRRYRRKDGGLSSSESLEEIDLPTNSDRYE